MAMFLDTQPASLDAAGDPDRFAAFRVTNPTEIAALLRQLRDGSVPVVVNTPDAQSITSTLWSVDPAQGRMFLAADEHNPRLQCVVDADEATAVAYLENVKLQFDLSGMVLVRGPKSSALQCSLPREVYRFQRRRAYRVRTLDRSSPTARLRHPSLPEMQLTLRVLDVSIGGCALLVGGDVPPLPPGARLAGVQVDLDADTRFGCELTLHHVSSVHGGAGAVRLGCEWHGIDGAAQRALQRYIDQTQKRRRLMALAT